MCVVAGPFTPPPPPPKIQHDIHAPHCGFSNHFFCLLCLIAKSWCHTFPHLLPCVVVDPYFLLVSIVCGRRSIKTNNKNKYRTAPPPHCSGLFRYFLLFKDPSFAKSRKAPVTLVMYICPYVRIYGFGCHWTGVREILYWRRLLKSVE
jgi:hypothetical protein